MSVTRDCSENLFKSAQKVIPGGVNSPVRAFKAVGGHPVFIDRASGPFLYDVDGNQFVDYICSWGPMILGHGNERVKAAIESALAKGSSYGAPTELEVQMAELLVELITPIQAVRMMNSGTEATMTAVRLARGYTGRDIIIKFDGCYHGHSDGLLVEAGSGVATLGIAGSPGIPRGTAETTVSIPFNDLHSLSNTVDKLGADKIAGIIVEPVPGNMGLVMPNDGFLAKLRELSTDIGAVLIFDEVMSGFRVGLGGACERFGIKPDLVTLGKVIGGGLPVAALGGTKEIMSQLAPEGPVYQAGTLSGNPLAMAAGIESLKILRESNPFELLEQRTAVLVSGLRDAAQSFGIKLETAYCGSMAGVFFSERPVRNYRDACNTDTTMFAKYFLAMLKRGVYLAPSAFEALFISTQHSEEIIETTIKAANAAFEDLAGR